MNSISEIVGWTSEPKGRGTLSLLWSCFATILLCTWNAIHPNIPAQSNNELFTFGERIADLITGLLAPEVFAVEAVHRYTDAKKLKSMVGQGPTTIAPS